MVILDPELEFSTIVLMNKKDILEKLIIITNSFDSMTDMEKIIFSIDFLKLKILLDTQLYKYKTCIGCIPYKKKFDFREILFDRNENYIHGAKKLLSNIKKISNVFIKNFDKITHILTDIDDTIIPHHSTLHSIAGSDYSDINKIPYSGIIEFYNQLKILNNDVLNEIGIEHYITVLSATPRKLKSTRLNKYINILGNNYAFLHGDNKISHSIKNILSGITKTKSITVDNNNTYKKKYLRFKQYKLMFPEYKFIIFGDNGQGDVILGNKILTKDKSSIVFIHNIKSKNGVFKFNDNKINETISCFPKRLYIYDNYLEVSMICKKLNIFSESQYDIIEKSYNIDVKNKKYLGG